MVPIRKELTLTNGYFCAEGGRQGKESTMLYTCQNCPPGIKASKISTDTSTRNNLNRHVKKYHLNKVEELEVLLAAKTKKVGRCPKTAHAIINDDMQTSILSFTKISPEHMDTPCHR
ncbi:unnamed protein product [Lepeophtheirus salmonis]|uniref:(salmon louse) hypothetical protein n=1 Tax=Lepeophtheirus salmonis TaxID=72036 RepID=A0A7R8HCJ8_LEPSM|nr:unnamed protein product [Lepeophtheirus salmonis]CAF3003679.1 unnamed protein product [Lepeophtheirus salmonis]